MDGMDWSMDFHDLVCKTYTPQAPYLSYVLMTFIPSVHGKKLFCSYMANYESGVMNSAFFCITHALFISENLKGRSLMCWYSACRQSILHDSMDGKIVGDCDEIWYRYSHAPQGELYLLW